ncbi:peptidoglycan-binding protein [Streptomyces sp. N50]|uniref:peptidoglycan-binding protein n=1 Tax=Streptomyces sp. N50 TaxID=3081765 RepID=UPI00296222E2|nr:peptidoglycan-binding protein [Streptomyces sp. N50]WOX14673.1 peptidoglycan-binding protein [Streptomyces sp. N50]
MDLFDNGRHLSRRRLLTLAGSAAVATATGIGFAQSASAASTAAATTGYGIDYSDASLTAGSVASAGYGFVCRYLSWLPNPKVLTLSEAQALTAADLGIVSNWESDGLQDWQSGVPSDPYSQGAGHATEAERQALANGMPSSRPIYFSVDFDLQPSMYSALNSYFDGVASVIGRSRTGAYGGYHVIKELFDNGKITWGWQTYAWSGGSWDSRAQLRQVQNGISVAGHDADLDQAMAADIGQWGGSGGGGTGVILPSWPNITDGMTGPSVQAAQYLLRYHGASITADGQFGADTLAATKSFQSAHGLGVDGQIGPQTWSALIVQVQTGSTGDAVRAAQVELNRFGYGLTVDGNFGSGTDTAARAFQSAHSLGVDGQVGPQTWQMLAGTGNGASGGSTVAPPWPNVIDGDTGNNVLAAQYLLRYHGATISADGQFGSGTLAAAKSFQSAHGLSVDGEIGPKTWSALIVQVQTGSTGDAVRAAQVELNKFGYGLTVDGSFGSGTTSAARAFQSAHSLGVDGQVGPQTWQMLVGS